MSDSASPWADNPFLTLDYVPAIAALGPEYADPVQAATFPMHRLRFRNDDLLPRLGLDPAAVSDEDFITAFGRFQGREPLLALRYHGYQFGTYNPDLGDGRGFLYGQVWGSDGELYDFGTKGSGPTPYSRGGDGRLTLKGGVREVLASEALHALGVRTSRTLSLIETGEQLWRGDEPSPTRSSVMVRFSRSHIRFGTFERLDYENRPDLIQRLLDHVIEIYYPEISPQEEPLSRYGQFYEALVDRTAALVAQWMGVGFCHAVLNTDNMSITGESFDYGPYAFLDRFDATFTAAYFDYSGRYCYRNQPAACYWNLEKLQKPLRWVMPLETLQSALSTFEDRYYQHYQRWMLTRLGLAPAPLSQSLTESLLGATLDLLEQTPLGYNAFFLTLTKEWQDPTTPEDLPTLPQFTTAEGQPLPGLAKWQRLYLEAWQTLPLGDRPTTVQRLRACNPAITLLRPEIEAIWAPITEADDWEPFYSLLERIRQPFLAA